jgi:hypothetical protein
VTEIASTRKITFHKAKLESYLRAESIFPATLELDLTSVCNRKCANCPSTTTLPAYNLSTDFVERLFARLEGQTRGLLLTGGEPTMAHNFVETLALARTRGFMDVVVVTNGSFLGDEKIAQALLTYASAIRISLYDWSAKSCTGMYPTLKRIEALRSRIEREGSRLQIGVSALTSNENIGGLNTVAREAESAGAHWVYFHPTCTRWELGTPVQMNQQGVLEQIGEFQRAQMDGFRAFVFNERYVGGTIEFDGYHSSHFLLVIGADGMNYLGAEVKYQPPHIIADVAGDWRDDFLWQSERLRRIRAVNSQTFPAIGSRHRGILYNNLIEQLRRTGAPVAAQDGFLFPHIL